MTRDFKWEHFSDHLDSVLRKTFLVHSNSDSDVTLKRVHIWTFEPAGQLASSQTSDIFERQYCSLSIYNLGENTFQQNKVIDFLMVAADLENRGHF